MRQVNVMMWDMRLFLLSWVGKDLNVHGIKLILNLKGTKSMGMVNISDDFAEAP